MGTFFVRLLPLGHLQNVFPCLRSDAAIQPLCKVRPNLKGRERERNIHYPEVHSPFNLTRVDNGNTLSVEERRPLVHIDWLHFWECHLCEAVVRTAHF
jgi:hypothetical protein